MSISIEEQLTHLNQIYKETEEIYHGIATFFGLSHSALWLLYSLNEANAPCTQAEICSTWSISKQTLNSALKGLKTAGYIQIVCSNKNQKSKHIVLTPFGKALIKKTVERIVIAEKQALSNLSKDERMQLVSLSQRHLELLKLEIQQITASELSSEDLNGHSII